MSRSASILRSSFWYIAFILIYVYVFREPLFAPSTYTAYDIQIPSPSPFPTLHSLIDYLFSAWSPNNLGYLRADFNLRYFWESFLMLFSLNNALMAQKLLGLHVFLSFFAMDFLLKNHFTKSKPSRFAGSLLYSFNPLTIKLSPPLWGYAFLPLALNYAFNILLKKEYKLRNAVFLGLLSALTVSFYFYYLSFIPLIVSVYFIVSSLFIRDLKYMFKCVGFLLISVSVFVLLMFPYVMHWYNIYYIEFSPPPPQVAKVWYKGWSPLNALMLFASQLSSIKLSEPTLMAGLMLISVISIPIFLIRRVEDRARVQVFSSLFIIIFMLFFGLNAKNTTPIFLLMHQYFSMFTSPLISPPGAMLLVSFSSACLLSISISLLIREEIKLIIKTDYESVIKPKKKVMTLSLLAILFTPYLTAYPILSHEPIIYPNPPSMDKIYAFLQDRGDNGSFRYYIVPFDVQSQENSRKFPNLMVMAGFTTREHFYYTRFIDNILVENMTRHLGALMAPGNVEYVIVDKVKQRWFKSDIATYTARYGDLRVKGYSDGIYGDWKKFSKILDKQEDLKLVVNESDFMVYENTMFTDRIHVYPKMTLIVGDRRALLPLVDELNFNVKENLVVFAEQNREHLNNLIDLTSSVIFYDSDFNDLLMSTFVDKFGLKSYYIVYDNCTVEYDFLPLTDPLYYSYYGFAYDEDYIRMRNSSRLSLSFNVSKSDYYDVWARVFFAQDVGELSLSVNGSSYSLKPQSEESLGFKWVRVGSVYLDGGQHMLTLTGKGKDNYIDEVIIAPSQTINEARIGLSDKLKDKEILLLYDTRYYAIRQVLLENLVLLKIDNISVGKWTTNLSLPVFIPSEKDYFLSFKLSAGVNVSQVFARIDSKEARINEVGGNFYRTDPILLKSGEKNISLTLPYEAKPKMFIVSTDRGLDSLSSQSNLSVHYVVKRVEDPTNELKYIIAVNASQPVFLTLSETFNTEWKSYLNDRELFHFTSYSFSNGFYVNSTGYNKVEIRLGFQKTRNVIVMAATIILVLACTYLAFDPALKVAKKVRKRLQTHAQLGNPQVTIGVR